MWNCDLSLLNFSIDYLAVLPPKHPPSPLANPRTSRFAEELVLLPLTYATNFPKCATMTTIVETHLVVCRLFNDPMIHDPMIQWFNDSTMAFFWWNLVNGHTLFNKAYHAHHCYPQKYGAVLVDASIQVSSSSSGMKISSSSSVTVHSPNTLFFSETKHWSFSAY